jgi:IS4 transposase
MWSSQSELVENVIRSISDGVKKHLKIKTKVRALGLRRYAPRKPIQMLKVRTLGQLYRQRILIRIGYLRLELYRAGKDSSKKLSQTTVL